GTGERARDRAQARERWGLEGRGDIGLGAFDFDLDEVRRRGRALVDNSPRRAHLDLEPLRPGSTSVVKRESAEIPGRIRGTNLECPVGRTQREPVPPDACQAYDVAFDHRAVFRHRLEAMNLSPRKPV